jgi:pimeloyl-ACP methyl ester carboxylesterase
MDRAGGNRAVRRRAVSVGTVISGAEMVEGRVEVGGAALAYHHRPALHDRRSAPVILLHPWFGCWQFWRRTVDALPEFDTYSVDLYSLGASRDWQDFAGPGGLARAVGSLIDALNAGRCHVIGNSMGGIAAQALAAERGHQIDKLILVGTGARTFGVKPDFRKVLDDWIAGDEDRDFTERLVGALLARRPESAEEFEIFVDTVARANKAFMGKVLSTAFGLDLRPVLPKITASTLVMRGARDVARTKEHVDELLAGIPSCAAIEIPGGGHSPQVDSPEAFCRAVRGFLLS